MRLQELLADYNGIVRMGADVEIGGICYDSRKVQPGDLFVCIRGFVTDGHNYASQAVAKGAAAVLCEQELMLSVPTVQVRDSRNALAFVSVRFYQAPSTACKLIGVTGTNGKTTVTYLLKSILEAAGFRVGLIGTNQNMVGDRVLPSERTTPESLELQQLFAEMVEDGVDYIVMEVSSHSLALQRVAFCQFDVGVFTNLTQDHLDFHHDMEQYLAAKAELFRHCTTGIVNLDDDGGRRILEQLSGKGVSYGVDGGADVFAQEVEFSAHGVRFACDALGRQATIQMKIPGRFTVYNALAAIGAATACGISMEVIKSALAQTEGVCGRAEVLPLGLDFTVMIDYAHTPDGLDNILRSVRECARGRVIALFGCGGDRDRDKRPKMGRIGSQLADFCILTSDNPRSEDPAAILQEIEQGMEPGGCPYVVIENRREAIAYALRMARTDDVVLLAGKGHETYQILPTGTISFDERAVVQELIKEMKL